MLDLFAFIQQERVPLLALAGLSMALVVLLVLTAPWHGRFSMDGTVGMQKFHATPTPRVGGLSVVAALVLWAWWVAPVWSVAAATTSASHDALVLLKGVLLAGSVAFVFGLLEDVTKRVSVLVRLLAPMASGVLAWWLTGVSITRVDVPFIDPLLAWMPFSVLFTAFAVGGVANALNIVDGFNGLASSTAVWAYLGLAAIAMAVGDEALARVCLFLAAVTVGFFVVNWPWGKIFLGDGGSYFLGFGLAWCAVSLIARNPSVSAFAPLLVCAVPIIEVLFSAFRRQVRQQSPGHPDRLHLHSLVKQRYVRRWFGYLPVCWRNSITGLGVGSLTLFTATLGYALYDQTLWAPLAFVGLCLGYVTLYARMVRQRWCSPFAFVLMVPKKR